MTFSMLPLRSLRSLLVLRRSPQHLASRGLVVERVRSEGNFELRLRYGYR